MNSIRTIPKVTAFLTRSTRPTIEDHELLVFRHPDAGIQLPAGSVEPGEDFRSAVLREVEEETGLSKIRLVSRLGTNTTELHEMKALFTSATLKTGPSDDADDLRTIPRGWWCRVEGEQDGFSEVVYEELNRNVHPQPVLVRFSGWVRSAMLANSMEREFFHVHVNGAVSERWVQRAEDRFDFECYWLPLFPKPEIHSPQQEWIDEYYEALVQSVKDALDE